MFMSFVPRDAHTITRCQTRPAASADQPSASIVRPDRGQDTQLRPPSAMDAAAPTTPPAGPPRRVAEMRRSTYVRVMEPAEGKLSSPSRVASTAKMVEPFVCGCFSACFAACVVHPVDLTKVRLQLFAVENAGRNVATPSLVSIWTSTAKESGVLALYDGISASLMRQVFYGTSRLGLNRMFADYLGESWAWCRSEGAPH